MSKDSITKGQERARKLGYSGLSEYIAFLIERDAHEKPRHSVIRDEKSIIHEASTSGYGVAPQQTPPDKKLRCAIAAAQSARTSYFVVTRSL